jgi:hypothetical protein
MNYHRRATDTTGDDLLYTLSLAIMFTVLGVLLCLA